MQHDLKKYQGLFLLGLLGLALLFLFLRVVYRKILDEENKELIYLEEKKAKTNTVHSIYHFLSNFVLTRHFVKRIRVRYSMYEPNNLKKIEEDTVKMTVFLLGTSLIPITIGFLIGFTLFSGFVTGIFVYALSSFIIFYSIEKKETIFLEQLVYFTDHVIHNYYSSGAVDTAIENTLIKAKYPIKAHMEHILKILQAADLEKEVENYLNTIPNRFLKMFLCNCQFITCFDDRQVEGESLFVRNLSYLKEEITIEQRKRKKLAHSFAGTSIVAILPLLTLQPMAVWAMSMEPKLQKYYNGPFGVLVPFLACILTLVVYSALNRMREADYAETYEHVLLKKLSKIPLVFSLITQITEINYGRTLRLKKLLRRVGENLTVVQFYVKCGVMALVCLSLSILLCWQSHSSYRANVLVETGSLQSYTTFFQKDEDDAYQEMVTVVVSLTKQYKENLVEVDSLKHHLEVKLGIHDQMLIDKLANNIKERIEKYQKDYFHWWELLLLLGGTTIGWFLPHWILLYQKAIMEMSMQNELVMFQSLILMMRHIERMNSRDILEWMKRFATIFREPIDKCISEYNSGELEALEGMKEDETYEPFIKIVDNLIDADRVGIKNAFREVEADRRTIHETRRLDNEIYCEDNSAIAQMIAFFPLYFSVAVYLGVPFITNALQNLFSFDLKQV